MSNKILTPLPMIKYGEAYRVNWKDVVGMTLEVLHYNKTYTFKVMNKADSNVTVIYKDEYFKIDSTKLLNGCIGNIVGTKTNKYKYNTDDILDVNTGKIRIIKNIRIKQSNGYTEKGYCYECLNDGYVGEITESNLINKQGCSVCTNRIVVKGINDVATTHPHLLKYFVNIEDAYTHSYGSEKTIKTRCPNCGEIRNDLSVKSLNKNNTYICKRCGDGIPYTERFMYNFLRSVLNKDDIITQYSPSWENLGGRKYDFYIPSLNCIIETHGRQHYEDKCFEKLTKKTLQEQQENDENKKEIALNNGIKDENYIIINCSKSEPKFIQDNILKSRLSILFDMNTINWKECQISSLRSITKEICDFWNRGYTMNDITNTTGLSVPKVLNSLKSGTKIGWCNYSTEESINRSMNKKCNEYKNPIVGINIKTHEVLHLNKPTECESYGMNSSLISMALNGKIRHHKDYVWIKLKDYIDTDEFKCNIIKEKLKNTKLKGKPIEAVNIHTNEKILFKDIREAKEKGFTKSGISQSCLGRIKQYKGYKWKYL